MFAQQLTKGDNYKKLKKTISISFLDYNLFERDRCHSLYEIFERHDKQRLSDLLQMYFIEIPKLSNNAKIPLNLRNWLQFLTVKNEGDLMSIRHSNKAIEEACDMLSKISSSEQQRQFAEDRRKALLDYNTNMEGAWEEGHQKGKLEGKLEGKFEGEQTGKLEMLLEVCELKFKKLPDWAITQIKATPAEQFSQMLNQAMTAKTIEEWLKNNN